MFACFERKTIFSFIYLCFCYNCVHTHVHKSWNLSLRTQNKIDQGPDRLLWQQMLASCRPWSTNAVRLKVLQHQPTGFSKELCNIMCSLVNYQLLLILVPLSKLIYLRWKLWPKLFLRLKWLFREWEERAPWAVLEDLLQPNGSLHVYWSQSRKIRTQPTCLDVDSDSHFFSAMRMQFLIIRRFLYFIHS